MGFIEKIFSQTFSNHPYLFLFIVMVTGGALTHSYNVFAQKEEVTKTLEEYTRGVDEKFGDLEKKIDENSLLVLNLFSDLAIRNYLSEIHTLTELNKAGNANERDRKRLRELTQDLLHEQSSIVNRRRGTNSK